MKVGDTKKEARGRSDAYIAQNVSSDADQGVGGTAGKRSLIAEILLLEKKRNLIVSNPFDIQALETRVACVVIVNEIASNTADWRQRMLHYSSVHC